MQRRSFLAGMTAGTLAALRAAAASDEAMPLKDRAAARGMMFGSMVEYDYVFSDSRYAAAIARDCAVIVPGVEAKWYDTEFVDGRFAFSKLDALETFAHDKALALRLHNLTWGVWNPPWLDPALQAGRAEAVLRRHIERVVGRYRGRVLAWDVLNEPADPRWPSGAEGLIRNDWWHALGPGYAERAFHLAHEADPTALLFVNDDWLEYPQCAEKRALYLRLVESWRKRGVPIHGFGIEAHLRPDLPFDALAYRRFLADLASMDLVIHITELDVIDKDLPADKGVRDRIVAETAARFLSVALDEPAVKAVLTWGLSDQYSDLDRSDASRRTDGLPTRGAPLDRDFVRKPFWFALADAFEHAPARKGSQAARGKPVAVP